MTTVAKTRRAVWAVLVISLAVTVAASTGANAQVSPSGDWAGFGRTADNMRHSPLTEITRANVGRLERMYSVDFRRLDPDVRRGQQSYPLAIGGRLFVTTADANVFALEGATGRVLWQYKPSNSAVFKNFGIVANRGLAYCGGRLFITQLDMKIVALRPSDGAVLGTVSIDQDVPGASANYGYSETSAPMCAKGRLVVGAAGSEYGIRGFVMAYTTDLRPAWPTPFWTIPPDRQSWRRSSRIVGGGAVWTPVTIDASTNTVFFGTGSATPLYFPSLRPGANARTDALIAVDLLTGRLKWWQQLIAGNMWAYDVAQPPLVYDARVGDKSVRVVSVATMEGVWFAFDARSGSSLHQRVRVVDRVEHPRLLPGRPVTVFPSSLGGLNFSPASYDPATNFVLNAAAETAVVMVQRKLTPTQKRRKLVLGDVYLGLKNGDFGQELRGWHDHGSISAIDVATGRRAWKIRTPEPERGGVTTTATGLGFAGGGDGVLRALDVLNGSVLWRFQTGEPIAAGPTIFSANGKEYVAITVGGTPTSSNGGTASILQVFAIPGVRHTSTQPATRRHRITGSEAQAVTTPGSARREATAQATARARIVIEGAAVPLTLWRASSSNLRTVRGQVLVGGRPVVGARVSVDRYVLPRATDVRGHFSVPVDTTLARRHPVRVVGIERARVDGRALGAAERSALLAARGGISVAYRVVDVSARRQKNGRVLVTGRAVRTDNAPVPPVVLLTYRLSGTIREANGKPVEGATVITRTLDRNFWTFSEPSNAEGHYTSFFAASDQLGSNPVPMSVQVAVGKTTFTTGTRNVDFTPLRSADLDVRLTDSGTTIPVPLASASRGAIYRGLLVGVSGLNGPIRPISARWPDAHGRFSLLLPPTVRGETLRFWESDFQAFSRTVARPGGAIDLAGWPTGLSPRVPRDVAFVKAPR